MKWGYVFVACGVAACGSEVAKPGAGTTSGGGSAGGASQQASSTSSALNTTIAAGGATPECDSCAADEFCDHLYDSCGPASQGYCTERASCTGEGPVCTCAGTVEMDDCAAYASGQDLSADATCTPPPNTFRCGGYFCDESTELCIQSIGLVQDIGCNPAPPECTPDANGALSCDCAASLGCSCEEVAGQLFLTCNKK